MAFIPNGESQGLTATWLLSTAEEAGLNVRSIHVRNGGFEVPDELVPYLEGLVPVPPDLPPAEKTPPAWWDEPGPEVDVHYDPADGKYYATDELFLESLAVVGTAEFDGETYILELDTTPLLAPSTGVEPVSAESDSAVVPLDQPGNASVTPTSQTEAIRAWARQNGYEVADRGLLKKVIIEAYRAAQE